MYDWIGISCGVLAACFFAISYLVSGHALRKFKVTSLQLLALSSFWQGLIAFSILYFIWEPLVKPTDTILALWVTFLGYVFAQFLFFWTLRFISASRIAPLMGVKIIMVFIIALILFEETFTTRRSRRNRKTSIFQAPWKSWLNFQEIPGPEQPGTNAR